VGTKPTLNSYMRRFNLKNLEEKIIELIEPTINKLGYNLYDIEYLKKGKEYHLIIYIQNEKGISIEDCEKVSTGINEILDEANYIKEQYYLEVSSTGIEKVIRKEKHLNENIGNKVEITLYTKIDNMKQYVGILKSFNDDELILTMEEKEKTFIRKNIAQIKQVYDW